MGENSYVIKTPIKIHNLKNIQKIDCGEYFSIALDKQGQVFTWGIGNCGQLGHGNKEDQKMPKKINLSEKVK